MPQRKIIPCRGCGLNREHAARGFCFPCYYEDNKTRPLDDSDIRAAFAASDKKAQKTQFKGFVQMLSAMKSLDFPESTIREIWLLSEDYMPLMRGQMGLPDLMRDPDGENKVVEPEFEQEQGELTPQRRRVQ
jgi:hypothetical protein